MDSKKVSVSDAASILGVSITTVRHWLRVYKQQGVTTNGLYLIGTRVDSFPPRIWISEEEVLRVKNLRASRSSSHMRKFIAYVDEAKVESFSQMVERFEGARLDG